MSAGIALYARVSSAKQAREKTIEAQLEALRAYVESKGYLLEEDLIFIDDGVSGMTLERPGLDALREKLVAQAIDQVLVLSPDRLARQLAHQFVLIEEFRKLGVEIVFVDHPEEDTPSTRLYRHFRGSIAEYERELIVERGRRGKLHKAKQGDLSVMSGAPYGYIYVPKKLTGKAEYRVHPEESAIIQLIFQLLVQEKTSCRGIARHLTLQKIPTRRGGPWRGSTVADMVRNPVYMGKAAYRKTQSVPRRKITKLAYDCGFYPKRPNSSHRVRPQEDWIFLDVPAIVSPELFHQAQDQLAENRRLASRNTKYPYLLSGLLRCQACGYAFGGITRQTSRKKQALRSYYRCYGAKPGNFPEGKKCESRSIRSQELEDLVWNHVHQLLLQPDLVMREYLDRLQTRQQGPNAPHVLLKQARLSLHQQNTQKERLLDLYQLGTLSLAEIQSRLESIRMTLKELELKCQHLERECQQDLDIQNMIKQLENFRNQLNLNLGTLSFKKKQTIVRSLIQEIRVDPHNFQIIIRHTIPVSHKQVQLCPEHLGTS